MYTEQDMHKWRAQNPQLFYSTPQNLASDLIPGDFQNIDQNICVSAICSGLDLPIGLELLSQAVTTSTSADLFCEPLALDLE